MILFDDVTKVYPTSGRPALNSVSLEIERGDFVFLVGPSGSGKSTMLRLILREETATKGVVSVAGRNVGTLSSWKVPQLRRQIGTVFQDFRLLPNKTVYENVAFALQVLGKSPAFIAQEVTRSLGMVGLTGKARRLPNELSGGEQQRVAIARAFVNRPAILLADEPTGNLDPASTVDVMRLLNRIAGTGTTIVMATHNDEIVNTMRRRVIELDNGNVVRDEAHGGYVPASKADDDSVLAELASLRDPFVRSDAEPPTQRTRRRAGAHVAPESGFERQAEPRSVATLPDPAPEPEPASSHFAKPEPAAESDGETHVKHETHLETHGEGETQVEHAPVVDESQAGTTGPKPSRRFRFGRRG